MLTKAQATAIATAVTLVRREWDHPGVMAALDASQHMGSPATIARAIFALADRADIRSPGALRLPGPHWSGTPVADRKPPTMCPDHPDQRIAFCQQCAAERETDHTAGVAAVRSALQSAPRYTTEYHARMQRLREERREA